MTFKGTTRRAREIGEALNADYLLEGSVRREGDRVRITAQLIDARTDQHLWAQSYDRQFRDLCTILDCPELAEDARFVTNSQRVANREALVTLLQLSPLVRLPLLAGLPMLAVRSILLEWYRAAELSADRAALLAALELVERHYRDAAYLEFTFEAGDLWLLQARPGRFAGRAAVRRATDVPAEGLLAPPGAAGQLSDKVAARGPRGQQSWLCSTVFDLTDSNRAAGIADDFVTPLRILLIVVVSNEIELIRRRRL